MSIAKKLFLSFIAVILLNLLFFKFVFEDKIIEQLKNDRHEQYMLEKEAAERVRFNQLMKNARFKDPVDARIISEELPNDLMYQIIVENSEGKEIYRKNSQALAKKGAGMKAVSEYYFQHDPPNAGRTIIRFYTDESDILASKGVSMMVMYIYGSIVVIGLIFVALLVRWILRPVNELSRITSEIKSGKRNIRFSYKRNDEFGQLFHSFTDMVDQLRYSEDRQQELISAVAHDFRTPLTSIKGYASYISSGRVTDQARVQNYMHKIEERASALEELMDELQDFNQLHHEKPLNIDRFHVHTFMRSVIDEYRGKAKMAGLGFRSKVRVSEALHIYADEAKIRRVLENLLNNAIYYNKPDGSILLTCDQRDTHLLFSVIDKGEGIAKEDLNKIFTKFYRGEKSRNRNSGGTGLGLTICQNIVERHGGQIDVVSELGEGSCFSFKIPFHPSV
ncbi:sensor histidine kinase [Brevibacillus fulvus]|uniref:histidine kinase n=1 Tax=Brevibacillus fulvus TaxID=1125967 RepID=A0A938Y1B6_9BACL|nr:HAMP domain-containing sensor histidine kinase [Brevibacillus fulvus]MBM7589782.1 signal transduction histidine kinase [Brevibacillus fulvus]